MRYEDVSRGRFLKRPNRFLADVETDGRVLRCHVKNTGRLRELLIPGAPVWIQKKDAPGRKTGWDLISVGKETDGGSLSIVNIDSQAPNEEAARWIREGGLFPRVTEVKRERRFGDSRFDLYIEAGGERSFMEVKGVTLEESGWRSYEDEPMNLSVLVNSENPFRVRVAETVVRYLGYYGIQAEVEAVEYESYLSRLAAGDFDLFIAEVCVGDNVDISPLISGSSVGISGDCSDAQLLEQYYAYCAGTLDCAGLLEQFNTYVPVTPLVYRQGGAVVSPSFQAKMTPISQDIFYNIDEWQ